MNIKALFTPKLSKKTKDKYLYSELDKRKLEFEKEGLSGVEYKNKVLGAKTELEREIKNESYGSMLSRLLSINDSSTSTSSIKTFFTYLKPLKM
jgi:hypothetical protein